MEHLLTVAFVWLLSPENMFKAYFAIAAFWAVGITLAQWAERKAGGV